ncbi:MOSC domain-containing protein [bacterium]|nr:MOSC domain-containing protein [bacterium]
MVCWRVVWLTESRLLMVSVSGRSGCVAVEGERNSNGDRLALPPAHRVLLGAGIGRFLIREPQSRHRSVEPSVHCRLSGFLMIVRLSRITLYPIKSLPGIDVPDCRVLPSGALEWDRRLALFDRDGQIFNAKRSAKLHSLRVSYDLDAAVARLQVSQSPAAVVEFDLRTQLDELATALSRLLGEPLSIRTDHDVGFPDDDQAPGPTVISTASLDCVAAGLRIDSRDETHRRFRSNLVIDGVPAFWEDRLFGEPGQTIPFRIGEVTFAGINPCQRCVVPTRHPETGEPIAGFQKSLSQLRRSTRPDWSTASRFDHDYRLATNTVLISAGPTGMVRVGDAVEPPLPDALPDADDHKL